jgi:hypothetical protein
LTSIFLAGAFLATGFFATFTGFVVLALDDFVALAGFDPFLEILPLLLGARVTATIVL